MVKLKYIGNHQPQGMIIEVDEVKVKRFIDSGDYDYLVHKKVEKIVLKTKEVVVNDNSIRRN